MKSSECIKEVRRLLGAFPSKLVTSDTAEVYVEELAKLPYSGALHDAVTSLLASERWLPPIAMVREEYQRHHDQYMPPALPEPEMSEEDIAANMERLRVMEEHLKRVDGHAATFAECDHPECRKWFPIVQGEE